MNWSDAIDFLLPLVLLLAGVLGSRKKASRRGPVSPEEAGKSRPLLERMEEWLATLGGEDMPQPASEPSRDPEAEAPRPADVPVRKPVPPSPETVCASPVRPAASPSVFRPVPALQPETFSPEGEHAPGWTAEEKKKLILYSELLKPKYLEY